MIVSTEKKKTLRSKFIQTVKKAIEEKKGERITAIEMSKAGHSLVDFFIICEAANIRQTKAICDNIEEKVALVCSSKSIRAEGLKKEEWIILDYGDVMVHIMTSAHRSYYNLEELWMDVPQKNLS